MSWITVCEFRELAVGMPVAVMVDGDAICVVRAGDDVFAVHDECTHAAVPLSEGEVDGATIECWMHGSKWRRSRVWRHFKRPMRGAFMGAIAISKRSWGGSNANVSSPLLDHRAGESRHLSGRALFRCSARPTKLGMFMWFVRAARRSLH